jgi:hypothetical protein
MDINGAKALKQRLGTNGADEASPLRAEVEVEVAEDAPPIYHWTGVSQRPSAGVPEVDDEPVTRPSRFRRVGLSLR